MAQRVELNWLGDEVAEQLRDAVMRGLGKWSEHLLTEANVLVPHDEGTLERSGVASVDEETLQAGVSYDTPYAVGQHENPPEAHRGGRTWKYLETPFIASRETALALIARELRDEIAG